MIFAVSLLATRLGAETIGNVEFQFPPSIHEWKFFVDDRFYSQIFAGEEGFSEDEKEETSPLVKVFTHREGDALEIFCAMQVAADEEDEEDTDEETLASIQQDLNEHLNRLFPHHRVTLLSLTEWKDDGFCEWELHDGSVDLMHGYTRGFKKDNTFVVLSYLTTAARTEYNQALWTNVLNEAK